MVCTIGIWQIIDGLITILYFGLYKLAPLSGKIASEMSSQASQTLNSSMLNPNLYIWFIVDWLRYYEPCDSKTLFER